MNRNLLIFDQIRDACKRVSESATFVRIHHAGIDDYVRRLPLELTLHPEIDPGTHYLDRGEGTVAFFITLDAINFGSGYFPHLRKKAGKSGYFTIASGLNDLYREKGPLSAGQLAEMTTEECIRIFRQDADNEPAVALMGLFASALKDLGGHLLRKFGGSFMALVESAGGSAQRLVEELGEMPFFKDVLPYGELRVPFYKRAQITAADLAMAFGGEGPGRFDDIEELTLFADNLVPHVLRMDGILRYDEGLASRIDAGVPIPAKSPEEVELRACAVHAVELMAESLRKEGRPVSPRRLDYLLWSRGQQRHYKQARPRHRTRTVFY
jgi:hypothetical protein